MVVAGFEDLRLEPTKCFPTILVLILCQNLRSPAHFQSLCFPLSSCFERNSLFSQWFWNKYIYIQIPVSRNTAYPIRSRFRVAPTVSRSKHYLYIYILYLYIYIYRNTSFVLTHWAARNCRSIRVVWPMPSFVPGWIWQYKDGQNMHPVRSKFAKLLKNSLGLAWHSLSAQSPSQSNGIRKSIL